MRAELGQWSCEIRGVVESADLARNLRPVCTKVPGNQQPLVAHVSGEGYDNRRVLRHHLAEQQPRDEHAATASDMSGARWGRAARLWLRAIIESVDIE